MIQKTFFFGIFIAVFSGGIFLWNNLPFPSFFSSPVDSPLPSPSSVVSSHIKPDTSPLPTSKIIHPEEQLAQAHKAIAQGQLEYAISLLIPLKTPQSNSLLIDLYLKQKAYTDAESLIKDIFQREGDTSFLSEYIKVLLLQGKIEEALSLLSKKEESSEKTFYMLLISVMDRNHEQAQILAESLLSSQEYKIIGQAFLDVYQTYESFRDGSPHYLNTMLANVLKTLEFYTLAIEYIKPTLKEFPDYRDAWLVIGNSYLELKKFEVAERMLEKAVSLDPTHPTGPYLLGVVLYELGQTEDAFLQLQKAQKNGFKPRDQIIRILAEISFSEQQFEQSLEYYQLLLQDSENITLKDLTKSVYITLQELQTPALGRSLAEKAQEIFHTQPEAKALEGWVLLNEGKIQQSIVYLESLRSEYPNIPEVLLYLGNAYQANKSFEKAFTTYSKCYESQPFHPVSLECGEKYESLRIELQ